MGPFGRQRVDRGRRLARIDRPAHHGQRFRRRRMLGLVHDRHRGEGRHRWLAHRQHVRAGAQLLEEFDQIVDIVVEVETALFDRHVTRVGPVGDVDVVAWQHPLDRPAQQCREVPAHRRDDQQLRLSLHALLAEVQQVAERLAERDVLVDRDDLAADGRLGDSECRLSARRAGVREDIETCRRDRAERAVAERIRRIVEPPRAHRSPFARVG